MVIIAALVSAMVAIVPARPALASGPQQDTENYVTNPGCNKFWPGSGSLSAHDLGGDDFRVRLDFSLTYSELDSLKFCVPSSEYIELDFILFDFDIPEEFEDYTVAATNLPGAVKDTSLYDNNNPFVYNDPVIGVTGTSVLHLTHGINYYVVLEWNAAPKTGETPSVALNWQVSHWAYPGETVNSQSTQDFCVNNGGVPPYCIFATTTVLMTLGWWGGSRDFTTNTSFINSWNHYVSWGQYINQIVRHQDGTSWLVDENGRHWIPTGGDYECFEEQGANNFTLTSIDLAAIPDNTGSHAICYPTSTQTEGTGTGGGGSGDIDRLCYINDIAVLYCKDGSLTATWHTMASSVADVQIEDDRVGYLGTDGVLWVKEGGLGTTWSQMASDVASFMMDGDRVGYLGTDGKLWVKEGTLGATWVQMAGNVDHFDLEGDRVGYVGTDKKLWVKEGTLGATWVQMASNVVKLDLENDRVGSQRTNGDLYVKEGGLGTAWVKVSGFTQDFELEGNRIGVHTTGNKLKIKEGGLGATWNFVVSGPYVVEFELEGNRIGYISTGANFFVKAGAVTASWTTVSSNVVSMALDENWIGSLNSSGDLWVKEGAVNATWVIEAQNHAVAFAID